MSFALDLTRGQARVRQVVFNAGQPRPTVSIGRAAAWSLVAEDLEDVHAFVSFDGAALMVRSADERNPAWLDGQAVPCAWTPVGRASILALGGAQISISSKRDGARDDDEVTGELPVRTDELLGRRPNLSMDEAPTGEMTGARAPGRGLLPKPQVPPRAPLSVPDFDDATQMIRPGPRGAARPPVDDDEATRTLDISAAPVPARPARPNISIVAEPEEATTMLPLDGRPNLSPAAPLVSPTAAEYGHYPAPTPAAGQPAMRPGANGRPVIVAPRAVASHPALASAMVADPNEEPAPPSGATQLTELRPMVAPMLRPRPADAGVDPAARWDLPTNVDIQQPLGARPPVDPFAATGGNPSAARFVPPPPYAGAPMPSLTLAAQEQALEEKKEQEKKKRYASWVGPACAGMLLAFYGYFAWARMQRNAATPEDVMNTRTTVPVSASLPEGGLPTVADTDAAGLDQAMIDRHTNYLPAAAVPRTNRLDGGLDPALLIDAGQTTIQRAAVDAVAEGNLPQAIVYYERLATLAPDVPAYTTAARILRAQVAADAGVAPRF